MSSYKSNSIELAILDIDGVMTDGRKFYNTDGMPFSKVYCDKDFTAIKRLRAAGIKVCFLSGDETVNAAMAKNRNIDFYYARGKDKVLFLPDLCIKYNTRPADVLYIGDDLFDMNILQAVGYSFCPSDSPRIIKEICGANVLPRRGGENVITEMVDVLLERNLITDSTLEAIEELDKLEKF